MNTLTDSVVRRAGKGLFKFLHRLWFGSSDSHNINLRNLAISQRRAFLNDF